MAKVSRKTIFLVIYLNVVALVIGGGLVAGSAIRRAHRYDTLIISTARRYQVDPRLVAAVTWQESRFNPAAIGKKGEVGLMQVTEGAGTDWARAENVPYFSRSDLFDPIINVQAGTWYLAQAIDNWSHYPDPIPYALAEYNAGRQRASEWAKASSGNKKAFMKAIDIDSTRHYIEVILKRYRGGT